eukprot:m.832231 g.832231  ORF g.832231 m.832231 type:complete len:308 (-) comp59459_c0_seq3:2750-3673(-)
MRAVADESSRSKSKRSEGLEKLGVRLVGPVVDKLVRPLRVQHLLGDRLVHVAVFLLARPPFQGDANALVANDVSLERNGEQRVEHNEAPHLVLERIRKVVVIQLHEVDLSHFGPGIDIQVDAAGNEQGQVGHKPAVREDTSAIGLADTVRDGERNILEDGDHKERSIRGAGKACWAIVIHNFGRLAVPILLLDQQQGRNLEGALDQNLSHDGNEHHRRDQAARRTIGNNVLVSRRSAHGQRKSGDGEEIHVEVLPVAQVGAQPVEDEHGDELGEAVHGHKLEATERGGQCAAAFANQVQNAADVRNS